MIAINPFFFDPKELGKLATTHGENYQKAHPFPHVVLDDFLPEWVLEQILTEFPAPDDIDWIERTSYGKIEQAEEGPSEVAYSLNKLESKNTSELGPFTRQFFSEVNSRVFIEFLELLTGIGRLLPDPHLSGGGLHSIGSGGILRVHADFVWNERIRLDRRLNFLLYLNQDWKEDYGGELELWDKEMIRAEKKILPIFNRCVIFSTSSTSFHGHTNPITCPKNQRRKSLAFYYYSNGRPEGEVTLGHKEETLWQATPDEGARSTLAKRLLPPLLLDLVRYFRWKISLRKLLPPVFYEDRSPDSTK